MPGTRYSAKLGKSNDRVSNEQQQRQTWLNPDNNAEEDSSNGPLDFHALLSLSPRCYAVE